MTRRFLSAALFIVLLAGCAPHHYIRSDGKSLIFYLQKPEAKRVQFVASFDRYTPHDARKSSSGIWRVEVPLASELTYFYLVDGRVYVPECRFREKDDFGRENCLYLR